MRTHSTLVRAGWRVTGVQLLLSAGLLATPVSPALAQAPGASVRFADSAFEQVWQRNDAAVAARSVDRSWTWGPGPFTTAKEPYAEAPGGERLVQYFDKSRMEITYPTSDRSQPWFVTNGLLTKELVSGRLQYGDDQFIFRPSASDTPVAGDPNSTETPSYAVFRDVATINNDNRVPDRTGQTVQQAMSRNGRVRDVTPPQTGEDYRLVRYDEATGHNVMAAFWTFMTSQPDVDWLFVFGHPITEPYWVRATVQGREQDIVVQLFERRVLTFTPRNEAPWRVEMGNIGQHYQIWRYHGQPSSPLVSSEPATPGLPIHIRGFSWPAGGTVRIGIAPADDVGRTGRDVATTDGVGSFDTTLVWTREIADLYAEWDTNLVIWAIGPNGQQATTPLQIGNRLTERVSGTVVDLSRSARTLRVRLASGVIKVLAVTDETEVRRPTGRPGSFDDIVVGAQIEAYGSPGGSGAMLPARIQIRTTTAMTLDTGQ